MRPWIPTVLLAALAPLAGAAEPAAPSYRSTIETWQRERETRLRAEGGWLAVSGLFWLKPGENPVGSGPDNVVLLPTGAAPARAGAFLLDGKSTSVRLADGVTATVGAAPVTGTVSLRADTAAGGPDVLKLGRLSLFVIERGGRFAIRLKDPESPARVGFKGLSYFPVDPAWRVTAKFVPYDTPHPIDITNVLGQTDKMPSPGYVSFTVAGKELRLEPVIEEPGAKELFYIFRDLTSGKETYGAGRFLYSEMPKDGTVALDFNKAYSPPCAFTRYATCPLPPRQNRLDVRIPAGERAPQGLH
jgi:uncharacterized protein (DUF1684 family)